MFEFLPSIDSDEIAETRRQELTIPREVAQALGASAVVSSRDGRYFDEKGRPVDWSEQIDVAVASKVSIPPNAKLHQPESPRFDVTRIQVTNETTLGAARRLFDRGKIPIALNFANGVQAGGSFLSGALAQEESICRSSALFVTLENDPMYAAHHERPLPDSTDWIIYSPNVPVFRTDEGHPLDNPWPLSFITCAAPVATHMERSLAARLLAQRIERVFEVAHSFGYGDLVLGAWGCGAFGHDPLETAVSFKGALETKFSNAFAEIVFAIADWSKERKFLGPFRDVFC
jgi:uncharacterized protein (TIGR02452 family)